MEHEGGEIIVGNKRSSDNDNDNKQPPIKEKKAKTIACDRCRRRKVKCHGNGYTKAPCQYCVSVKLECTYGTKIIRKSSSNSVTKSIGSNNKWSSRISPTSPISAASTSNKVVRGRRSSPRPKKSPSSSPINNNDVAVPLLPGKNIPNSNFSGNKRSIKVVCQILPFTEVLKNDLEYSIKLLSSVILQNESDIRLQLDAHINIPIDEFAESNTTTSQNILAHYDSTTLLGNHMINQYLDVSRLSTATAIFLMGAFDASRNLRSRIYLGMATTFSITMKLHDKNALENLSNNKKEARMRLWWSISLFNHLQSLTFNNTMLGLDDKHSSIEYPNPSIENNEKESRIIEYFVNYVKITKILYEILEFSLNWKKNLPNYLQLRIIKQPIMITKEITIEYLEVYLCIVFNYAIIRLHHTNIYSTDSLQKCMDAANEIIELYSPPPPHPYHYSHQYSQQYPNHSIHPRQYYLASNTTSPPTITTASATAANKSNSSSSNTPTSPNLGSGTSSISSITNLTSINSSNSSNNNNNNNNNNSIGALMGSHNEIPISNINNLTGIGQQHHYNSNNNHNNNNNRYSFFE
ncbi:9091_t:CDS:2 [Entrophospora sp. SA101]|nr:9091_t:CDS:2 [Entrophospora sp. SA101]